MNLKPCTLDQAPGILAIFNDAILNSTALYEYKPWTMDHMVEWFEAKRRGNFPVVGAFGDGGDLVGFASYGVFRARPAYHYSVEHSIYVRSDRRGQGIGTVLLSELVETAMRQDLHMMVGGIDSSNQASLALHAKLGFQHCGTVRHAGFKFGRWLDLLFYQRVLPTPAHPRGE